MSLGSLARPGAEGVEMLRTAALLTLAGLAVLAAMRLLADVLVPFTLALFLALLLNPLIDALVRRMRWPRPVAVGVSFAAGAALLAAIALAVVPALASNVAGLDYPAAAERMAKRMPEPLRDAAAGADLPAYARRAAGLLIPAAGDGLLRLVSTGGLVLVFLLFLLLGRGEKPVAPDSLRGQVERRIQGYIAVTFLISAATGALVGLTLWLLGVPFAWLFGVLAFALNFVPNVGSAVATLLPLPVILLDDSMSTAARAGRHRRPGGDPVRAGQRRRAQAAGRPAAALAGGGAARADPARHDLGAAGADPRHAGIGDAEDRNGPGSAAPPARRPARRRFNK